MISCEGPAVGLLGALLLTSALLLGSRSSSVLSVVANNTGAARAWAEQSISPSGKRLPAQIKRQRAQGDARPVHQLERLKLLSSLTSRLEP